MTRLGPMYLAKEPATIIDNLVALSKLPPEEYSFHITLRRNLLAGDEDYSWYDYLYRLFGQDKRFDVLVCAVGDWGGKAPTICHPFTRILKRCWLRSYCISG